MKRVASQLTQLTKKHLLEWWRFKWGCYTMVIFPAMLICISFGPYRFNESKPVSYQFDSLTHPIYPIAKLDPETNTWGWGQEDRDKQTQNLQEFMWYNNYANVVFDNETYTQMSDLTSNETEAALLKMNETIYTEKGKYDPGFDIFGPNNFIPFHCYSADKTKKYESPIIGYIDNGNEITNDIITQLKAIFEEQTQVKNLIDDLDEFLDAFDTFLNPLKALTQVSDSNEEPDEDEKTPQEALEEVNDLDQTQTTNVKLLQFLGDAVHNDDAVDFSFDDFMNTVGYFTYQAFESKEAIDDYVSQPGYGWDEDKPGLCFALGVTENDKKNKYELEMFFNDQWPEMQAGIPLQQLSATPLTDDVNIDYYMKYQYNGFSYLQHFVANSILQRKTNPDAMIVNMVTPQLLKPFVFNQQSDFMIRIIQIYLVLIVIPVVVVMSHQVLEEKESGVKKKILATGVNYIVYWASWWAFFAILSVVLAVVIGLSFWAIAFQDASIWLVISFFFLVNLSTFAFVWATQPLFFSKIQSGLIFLFMVVLLVTPYFTIDQTHIPVENDRKKRASISMMMAANEILKLLTEFSSFKYGLDFTNFHEMKDNYSVKLGFDYLGFDFLLYFTIGCILEACIALFHYLVDKNSRKNLARIQTIASENILQSLSGDVGEKARIINDSTEIKMTGLHVIDVRLSSEQSDSINLYVKPGEICCITGNNREIEEREHFLRVLMKQRPLDHGNIYLNGVNMEQMKWSKKGEDGDSNEIILLKLLTAKQNLDLYLGICDQWLTQEIFEVLKSVFLVDQPVNVMPYSKQKFLKVLIQLCTGDHNLLVLEEPTVGLDIEQCKQIYYLINRLKQRRAIIINTKDQALIELLADQVFLMSKGFKFIKLSKDEKYSVQVAVQCHKSPEHTIQSLSEQFENQAINGKVVSRQNNNFVVFENFAKTEKEYNRILQTLNVKQEKAGAGNIKIKDNDAFLFAITQKSVPITSELTSKVTQKSLEKSLFQIIYELRNGEQSDIITENFLREAKFMTKAKQCAIRVSESETRLLICEFSNEEFFNMTIQQNDLIQDKLNGTMVEMLTGDIFTQRKVVHEETEVVQDKEATLFPPIQHEKIPTSIHPIRKKGGINANISVKGSINTNLTIIKEEDDHISLDQSMEQAPRKNIVIRIVKVIFGECFRQARLGKRQILLQTFLPMVFVFYGIRSVSFLFNQRSESTILGQDMLPSNLEIFINKKVKYGNVEPIDLVSYLDNFEDNFRVQEIETQWNRRIDVFKQKIYEETVTKHQSIENEPYQYGSYEFYELNNTSHHYMFTTLVNITSPHSSVLFPQFMLEAVLRLATEDPEFEFKTKSTPYPLQEAINKSSFSQIEQFQTTANNNYIKMLKSWEDVGLRLNTIFCFAYMILSGSIVSQLVKERTERSKQFQTQHGLPRVLYWLVRYGWDLLKFIPLTYVILNFSLNDEPQLVVLQTSVRLFPFAYLPFLYVIQHRFENQVSAQIVVIVVQMIAMVILPFATAIMKVSATTSSQEDGDSLSDIGRILFPPFCLGQTVMFNSEMIRWMADARFVQYKEPEPLDIDPVDEVKEEGESQSETIEEESNKNSETSDIQKEGNIKKKSRQVTKETIVPLEQQVGTSLYPQDPWDDINGGGDVKFLYYHLVFWWIILIVCVDMRGSRHGIAFHRYFIAVYKNIKENQIDTGNDISDIEQNRRVKIVTQKRGSFDKLALKTNELIISEPHRNSLLGIVCQRGTEIIGPQDIQVKIGQVVAIIGASGTGKSTIMTKLADRYSPTQHKGLDTIERYTQFSFAQQQDSKIYRHQTVMSHFEHLSNLGKIKLTQVTQYLSRLGYGDLLDTKIAKLLPKQLQVLKIATILASTQELLLLDAPFTSLDKEQKIMLASLLNHQQSKAIIVSLNKRSDLDLLNPDQYYALDDTVIAIEPYIRLILKLKPQGEQEVQDFLENFFDSIYSEKTRGTMIEKVKVIEAIENSTMSKLSIEQLQDHLIGLPVMIDLEQQASEFLAIFKIYKVIRQLADEYGEIEYDWQVKDTVAVKFVEQLHLLKPQILINFLKTDFLVRETVLSFQIQAQFDNTDLSENDASDSQSKVSKSIVL